jgi:hypothetical protein
VTRARRTATAALGAALALVLVTAPARADDEAIAARRMAFAERGADLVVSTRFPELFDQAALDAVSSGLPVTVVVRLYVYRSQGELPVALAALQLDLVYDLWDEAYVVRTRGPRGSAQVRLTSRAEAIEAVTSLREVPAAALARIPIGPHHFAALVAELNPVSDELLAEMRRWLTRRAGDRLDASASFFGSFVSVFVNPKLEGAERTVRLRSQPFYRVAR